MRIWVDDLRAKPEYFTKKSRDAWEVIELLKTNRVIEISLDDDLANETKFGNGLTIAQWIEANADTGTLKRLKWQIHCKPSAMSGKMKRALLNADLFWDRNDLE